MMDTKNGRETQAADEERRQRERDVEEARSRSDEAEPPEETGDATDETRGRTDDSSDSPRTCHRRGCDKPALFEVYERYRDETGHGAVEATALLCQEHTDEETPTNLDATFEDYLFRVEPHPPASETNAT